MALEQDIYYQLRVAYIALLKNQITVNGQVIPVVSGFYTGTSKMYILITGVSSTETPTKSVKITNTAIQFGIRCKGDSLTGNEADDIAGQLINLVMPNPTFRILSNDYFDVSGAREVSNVPITGTEGNTAVKILERNIIIEHDVTHRQRGR